MKSRHKSGILCAITCAGVIGTAISTYIATRKSKDILDDKELSTKDKVIKVIPKFIPTVLCGGAAIGCSITGHVQNQKQIKTLAGAYMTISSVFNSYRSEILKEENGAEIDERCYKKALEDHKADLINIGYPGGGIRTDDWIRVKDEYSGDIIETTLYDVKCNMLNIVTMYTSMDSKGYMDVNSFRWVFGFPWSPEYVDYGWSLNSGCDNMAFKPLEYNKEEDVWILDTYDTPRLLELEPH